MYRRIDSNFELDRSTMALTSSGDSCDYDDYNISSEHGRGDSTDKVTHFSVYLSVSLSRSEWSVLFLLVCSL